MIKRRKVFKEKIPKAETLISFTAPSFLMNIMRKMRNQILTWKQEEETQNIASLKDILSDLAKKLDFEGSKISIFHDVLVQV